MGIYANYTNGKLIFSKKPITINSIIYDPDKDKKDIKGFKWFKNKTEAYKFFNIFQTTENELHLAKLTNGSSVYVVGIDDMDCRDKIYEFMEKRFFADPSIQIESMEHIAETSSKGFVDRLLI
jgi:hypothetical protein